jgi:hypothetical protein
VTQEQLAHGAENKLKTVESEQKQKVAVAEAEAKAVKATADGDAYATLTNAKASAESLRIQNAALAQNRDVLELRRIEVERSSRDRCPPRRHSTQVTVRILQGDCRDVLKTLPDESVHCVVTSPPYWGLRDYGVAGHIGLEQTLVDHLDVLAAVFSEVRRVLRNDGTLWLNYGDAYAGSWGAQSRGEPSQDLSTLSGGQIYAAPKGTHTGSGKRTPGLKPKDLMGLPWRFAFALQDAGWWLRSDIIWHKPNPMPESITDRPTKSHEYIFLLAKSERYYYDAAAIAEEAKRRASAQSARWSLTGGPPARA